MQSASALQVASQRPAGVQVLPAAHWLEAAHGLHTWLPVSQCGRLASTQSVLEAQPWTAAQQPDWHSCDAGQSAVAEQLCTEDGHWPGARHSFCVQTSPAPHCAVVVQADGAAVPPPQPPKRAARPNANRVDERNTSGDDDMQTSKGSSAGRFFHARAAKSTVR